MIQPGDAYSLELRRHTGEAKTPAGATIIVEHDQAGLFATGPAVRTWRGRDDIQLAIVGDTSSLVQFMPWAEPIHPRVIDEMVLWVATKVGRPMAAQMCSGVEHPVQIHVPDFDEEDR